MSENAMRTSLASSDKAGTRLMKDALLLWPLCNRVS